MNAEQVSFLGRGDFIFALSTCKMFYISMVQFMMLIIARESAYTVMHPGREYSRRYSFLCSVGTSPYSLLVDIILFQTNKHQWRHWWIQTLIARFVGPTWGPSGADSTQVGPMSAPWTLLSGKALVREACLCLQKPCVASYIIKLFRPHDYLHVTMVDIISY